MSEIVLNRTDSERVRHLDLPYEEDTLTSLLDAEPLLDFIHVHHPEQSTSDRDNIITLARKDPAIKRLVVLLANAGFHLYTLRSGVSSLVRHRSIPTLWHAVKDGKIDVDDNRVFFNLTLAPVSRRARLLVIFSSIASNMYSASLHRHFEQNFATIAKYIPENTHILRIVDFGSVVGSFYLNSNALPNNETNIWELIERTASSLDVDPESIVLYGSSKGGTAATFYALQKGVRAVAVDPILSDQHYIQRYNDSHFTLDTFPSTKEVRFEALIPNAHAQAKLSMICSDRSPQFAFIEPMVIQRFADRFLFLNSDNTGIRDHPDVAPKTIAHTLAQINMHLTGLEANPGVYRVW